MRAKDRKAIDIERKNHGELAARRLKRKIKKAREAKRFASS